MAVNTLPHPFSREGFALREQARETGMPDPYDTWTFPRGRVTGDETSWSWFRIIRGTMYSFLAWANSGGSVTYVAYRASNDNYAGPHYETPVLRITVRH